MKTDFGVIFAVVLFVSRLRSKIRVLSDIVD